MTTSEVTLKMVQQANGNLHDINHFMKVYAFAKAIGESENLTKEQQLTLEIAAIVHDIACPLCREKYGNTNGKYQEAESAALLEDFFAGTSIPQDMLERVIFLVSHHHTYEGVDGMDYQILLEADYLVNAEESHYSDENIQNARVKIFGTRTGIVLLDAMYGVVERRL